VDVVAIPKNRLLLMASVVWGIAGAMVCRVGFPLLWTLGPARPTLYLGAAVTFLIFYWFIFRRLVGRHMLRIRERPELRLPFWNFFDARSYVVMAIMMGGGMGLRLAHLIPGWMIAFFYSGLGFALFSCAVRFLAVFLRGDVLKAGGRVRGVSMRGTGG
jgi:hypothetical protein